MSTEHCLRSIFPSGGAQAFGELHDEIAAVRDDQLVPLCVDIAVAHEIALAAADRIDELMPELETLPKFDIVRARKLRMYAAACQHAHVLATTEQADRRLPRLLVEGARLREDLLATAELLVRFGEVSAERVAAIRSGVGHVEMANGIEQLGVLFAAIWDRVASRVPVTADMVERAQVLALEIHALLGAKKVRPITRSLARAMRQRAFTLLVKVYEECRSGVEYIRRHEGDAASFTPSLFVKQKRRRTTSATTPVRPPIAVLAATG